MLTKTKKTKRKVRKASGARRPLKAVRGAAGVNAVVNNMSSERGSLIPETGRAAPERSLGGEGASVSPMPGEGMEKASASKNNRTCFVTRKTLPKERLLRFVLGPGRILAFDLNNKLPGRGYWLCCDGFVVRQAVSKNLFQKAMRGTVKIPEGFEEQIAEGMRRRCLQRISLCKKAGVLLSGFEKVKDALSKGKVQILLQACDGGADGREKLEKVCSGLEEKVFLVQDFSGEELGVAIGWDKGVHVCIEKSPMAVALIREIERMRSFLDKEEKKEDN